MDSKNNPDQGYSQYNQVEIKAVAIYRDGWKSEDYVDIRTIVEEINIFEDLFSPTLTASLFILDTLNMVDRFPIIGGERILLQFKTPTQTDDISQEFVIYKVAKRAVEPRNGKFQSYGLMLCTPDRYKDANTDISKSFKGTYTDIINQVMNLIKSPKPIDSEQSAGINSFISPYWSPLKICSFAANRAIGDKFEPFFFYEDLDGYKFKSSKTVYKQDPVDKYFIQLEQSRGEFTNAESSFKSITTWEVIDGNDRLQQNSDGLFGAKVFQYNMRNKTLTLNNYDYTNMFDTDVAVKIEQYPLYDDVTDRTKTQFIFEKFDKSHLGAYYRKMMFGMLASYGLRVAIKGNSSLRVGKIIELDIPSPRITGGNPETEQVTSGRWLITSLKHIIKKDGYSTILELSKDSYAKNMASLVTTGDKRNEK
ncbi:hypothetical protein [Ralstonia phage RSP15]|uniref:tail protein n=1 Tax=Ralstonia phage RSP15 TaxID=1785960 RepID=UPI00074D3344|nr:tail protein [Ralstonia phage RSP15]BAU40030.1 hypothetical protein [Ralstonia phage RSP15]